MVYMYHSFLVHSSADGHLGCFHVLAMTKKWTYKNSNTVVENGQKTWIKFTSIYKNGQLSDKIICNRSNKWKNVQCNSLLFFIFFHNSLLEILKLKQKLFKFTNEVGNRGNYNRIQCQTECTVKNFW